jgi:hypothetical protein
MPHPAPRVGLTVIEPPSEIPVSRVTIRFACPACDAPDRFELPGPPSWHCPACGHAVDRPADAAAPEGRLACCAQCGNGQLYRRKDFPQWLGMLILTGACVSFFVLAVVFYQYILAWAILLGSALFDGLLYGYVGDVVVCYRCGCEHRGVRSRDFDPFELATAERYRQERLRREQMQVEKKS